MNQRSQPDSNLIYSVGTQVVSQKPVQGSSDRIAHPAGAVGVIVRSPADRHYPYRVRFADGFEAPIAHDQLILLAEYKSGLINDSSQTLASSDLYDRVIFRCVIGSRAYGLEDANSDTDRRGIYLPPADLHWSLYGVPEQLENEPTQEAYWELQKFMVLALKANPNVLECLYTPIVETATPLAQELLAAKEMFLSKLVFQTYSGYVASQFKKMQADIRNHGSVKWKHVMHLIRLLMSGVHVLNHGFLSVQVGEHRDQLLAIKAGEIAWPIVDQWRMKLHDEFEQAFQTTKLPDRPDYERSNEFLIRAQTGHAGGIAVIDNDKLMRHVDQHPYPLMFATISGAHLYGFPSPDSDFDLRGVHLLPLENVVGLNTCHETVEKEGVYDGLEIDLVTHDAKKFFGLMLKRNGYVLEQIFSPLIVHATPEHEELKQIAGNCITRYHAYHYLGFAATQWKLFQKESPPRVKPLLYVYRVLLTGIHLMRSGAIEANLLKLNSEAKLAWIEDLISLKLAGPEKAVLEQADIDAHRNHFERLVTELEQASADSELPEMPTGKAALNDLLVRLRLNGR